MKKNENSNDTPMKFEAKKDSETTYEAVGVTLERSEELKKLCIKAFKATDSISEACALASESCKTPQELFLAVNGLTQISVKIRNNPLTALMFALEKE